jgi:hypothetical protein
LNPVYTSRKFLRLIDATVSTIQDQLKSLRWLEYVYGLVQKGVLADGLEYPQTYPLTKTDDDSYDIRPNSDHKSYCFFELVDPINSAEDFQRCTLNLVVWGNLKKIKADRNFDFVMELVEDITITIKSIYPVIDLDRDSFRIFTRNEDIFSYSGLLQKNKQYLMKPYFGFKVQFDVLILNCNDLC